MWLSLNLEPKQTFQVLNKSESSSPDKKMMSTLDLVNCQFSVIAKTSACGIESVFVWLRSVIIIKTTIVIKLSVVLVLNYKCIQ